MLAQPAPAGSPVVVSTADGTIVTLPDGAAEPAVLGEIGGAPPVAPIAHGGCVFALATAPPTFTRFCGGVADQTTALQDAWARHCDSASSTVGSGSTTSTPARSGSPAPRASSTGSTTGAPTFREDSGEDTENPDGDTEQRQNPDADDAVFTRADELDEDGINEPPVARDDQVRTAVDQPVVVDVLDNDEDPDGDVLLVTSVCGQSTEALVTPTADRTQVQAARTQR